MEDDAQIESPTVQGANSNRVVGKITWAVFGIFAAVAFFKVSVVSIGDRTAGHVAIIWKDDGTSSLRVFDSAKAACERTGYPGYLCEGRLAIVIQDRNLRLVRLPYLRLFSKLVGGR